MALNWPDEHVAVICRDQGHHYYRYGNLGPSIKSFAAAIDAIKPEGEDLYRRKSLAEYRNCDLPEALSSVDGTKFYPGPLQKCHALFRLSEFERHLLAASDEWRQLGGHRKRTLAREKNLAIANYECILGNRAGACLLERYDLVGRLARRARNRTDGDTVRPRWKILRERGECDAVSVLETVQQDPPLLKVKRQEKNMRILGQVYLDRGWKDWVFLKELRKEGKYGRIVELPQMPESSSRMSADVEEALRKVTEGVKNLQAGCPLYSYRKERFGSMAAFRRFAVDELMKLRYKTYRDVYNQLDRMYELRDAGKRKQLFAYAGDVLWFYYQIKTQRVFPEKFKFVREICNLVGLAIVEELRIPPTVMDAPKRDRLYILLGLPLPKEEETVVSEFDLDQPDYAFIRYKNQISELEKRCQQSQYPIERCFLNHEKVRKHIGNDRLDEAKVIANKIIEDATLGSSLLWRFIGCLAIVKANCAQFNLEQMEVSLETAVAVAYEISDERILHVLEVIRVTLLDLLFEKSQHQNAAAALVRD